MSFIRFPKVRITDHRPPGAGSPSPLERRGATRGGSVTGLDYLTASQRREAEQHDRAVKDYGPALLDSAYEDLKARPANDRKNPEHRWIMARRAALLRRATQPFP